MQITKISTEDPKTEQWKMLSQFSYPVNIQRFRRERNFPELSKEICDYIAGCIRQADAYFQAFQNAPLDISPLLLYYGSSNLLEGAATLITGERKEIKNHGMKIIIPGTENYRISNISIQPLDSSFGALQHFCNIFGNNCSIVNGDVWSAEEVFGSIPDLKRDFELCYGSFQYYVPIDVVRHNDLIIERIQPIEMEKFRDEIEILSKIEGLNKAYLTPQIAKDKKYIILNRRLTYTDIGEYSIFGQKFLVLGHLKNNTLIAPSSLPQCL
jgi:hypothetical protein